MILQRRRLIAICTGALLSLAIGVTLLQTSIFRASALLHITQGRINLAAEDTIDEGRTKSEEFYATQDGILNSRMLSERVMNRLDLWQHPLFVPEEPDPAIVPEQLRSAQIDRLREMLRVTLLANTQLVRISYETPDPELSAALANTLAREYIAYSAQTASGVAGDMSDFIREQIDKLQSEIEESNSKLQSLSEREDMVLLDERENITLRQLEELNAELTEVQAERAEAEARYSSLQRESPESFPEILDNRAVQDLKRDVAELRNRHADLSNKFKPGYPELVRTGAALQELEAKLDEETRKVAATVVAAARVRFETARDRERILRQTLRGQRQEIRDVTAASGEYQRIKAERDNQQLVLEQLLARHSETGLAAELGDRERVMTVRLVDEAVVPTSRYRPSLRVNAMVGILLGLMGGIGIAFVLNYWQATLNTADDVKRYVGLPLLGLIPRDAREAQRPERTAFDSSSTQDSNAPSGLSAIVGERFKFLRQSLLLSSGNRAPKTILVTSSTEAEGKSFVASRLAMSLTDLKKKVLLIDADLRRPVMGEVFPTEQGSGVTSVLGGEAGSADAFIEETSSPHLSVLYAGPHSPAPAELIASDATDALLADCSAKYDYVVLDSAPLLPVVDTHALAARCDAVVLVTRAGITSRHAVTESKELVGKSNGRITGIVLNDVDLEDFAQRRYHSYGSYEYGEGSSRRSGADRSAPSAEPADAGSMASAPAAPADPSSAS